MPVSQRTSPAFCVPEFWNRRLVGDGFIQRALRTESINGSSWPPAQALRRGNKSDAGMANRLRGVSSRQLPAGRQQRHATGHQGAVHVQAVTCTGAQLAFEDTFNVIGVQWAGRSVTAVGTVDPFSKPRSPIVTRCGTPDEFPVAANMALKFVAVVQNHIDTGCQHQRRAHRYCLTSGPEPVCRWGTAPQ
jgi:hypothetical protein